MPPVKQATPLTAPRFDHNGNQNGDSSLLPVQTSIPSYTQVPRFTVQTRTRMVPVKDLRTGEVTYRQETSSVAVPATASDELSTEEERLIAQLVATLRSGTQFKLPNDEVETKKHQLTDLVTKQFEKRHAEQTEQLEAAQKQADELRATLETRLAAKSEIVDRRIKDLLGEPDPLKWDNTEALSAMKGDSVLRAPPTNATSVANIPKRPNPLMDSDKKRINPAGSLQSEKKATGNPPGYPVPLRYFGKRTDNTESKDDRLNQSQGVDPTVFSAADQLVRQHMELRQLQSELKQQEELHHKGALPSLELAKTKSRIAAVQASNEVLEMQMEQAESISLVRLQAAERAHRNLLESTTPDDAPDQRDNLTRSENALEIAKANTHHLKQLRERLDQLTADSDDSNESADAKKASSAGREIPLGPPAADAQR